MQNTAKIFVLRLLFSILMICFFSGFTSQYRYLMKLQHQVDLETEGKYKELLEEYMEDLKSAREKQNRYPQISKLKQIGQVYLQKLKDYSQAVIQYLQDVIDEYESGRVIFSRSDLDSKLIQKIDSLDELAYAFQKLGIKQKAVEALAELINYFEEIRAKLTKESQKISYMGTRNEVYDRIIELLLSQGRASEALDYVERARARAFIDILGDKELKAKSQKVQELLTKKKSAETRYYGLLQEISGDVASRERSIQIVQKEMDGVLKKIEKDDAELLSMTTVKTLKASEIQNLIDSDTAIAEYYVTRDGVLIWIVTSDSIQATKVEIPEWLLAKKVLEFRENVTNPGIRNRKEDLKEKISSVRLEITPARFKKDEEYSIRVYAQNNMSLFLSIDKMDTKIGEYVNTSVDMLEREIPGGEERLISEAKYVPTKFFSMNITPGVHQVILHTDQGKLASNILEVAVHENNLVTITDKGFDEEPKGVRADLYKYENMSLYDILIKPVNPHLTRKRLGIVPHGILHYLPFAALRHNDRFLIEDYSLVYFTSATVYKFCKNKSKELGGEILAFGNPDLGQPSLDIPFALKEVASISNLYPKSQVLVRAEASEEAFKSLSGSYNVLHLASHGTFNADQPLQSALLLSPSGKEDGKLTVSEIFDLELNASLVTLSACQSGMSRIKAGDELMGFPRAFIYAGVPAVVATLWNVSDEATAILMDDFYRNLKVSDKAEALRSAQLKLLKNPGSRNAYYWAAFYLTGDFR